MEMGIRLELIENSHVRTLRTDEAYGISWNKLMKMMIEFYCPRNEIQKMVPEEEDKIESLMDQKIRAKAAKEADDKRKWDDKQDGNHCQHQNKQQEVGRVYVAGTGNKIGYVGILPLCEKCKLHHHGPCPIKCRNFKKVDHQARNCWTPNTMTCYRYEGKGHTKRYCPELGNVNED
ncbi:putative reverse transcriptase domain-containing protein [Tanacetum coccineum]